MANTQPRKLTVVRKTTEPLRLEQGEAVHVGVDVHKASYRGMATIRDSACWASPGDAGGPDRAGDRPRP